jgi:hypothetical protein
LKRCERTAQAALQWVETEQPSQHANLRSKHKAIRDAVEDGRLDLYRMKKVPKFDTFAKYCRAKGQ